MNINFTLTSGVTAKALGDTILTLKSSGEQFSIDRPVSKVHNLISNPYVYHEGVTSCTNLKTGEKAVMNLIAIGMFNSKEYEIKGKAFNS